MLYDFIKKRSSKIFNSHIKIVFFLDNFKNAQLIHFLNFFQKSFFYTFPTCVFSTTARTKFKKGN